MRDGTMQDVFWDGFADEVEKLASKKALLAGGLTAGAAMAAAAGGGEKKPKKGGGVRSTINERARKLQAAADG